jgi:hypothetical protein
MSPNDIQITGMEHVFRVLAKGGEAAAKEVPGALFEVAHEIMAVSQREVPVDTGVLRASGTVLEPVSSGDGTHIDLGYGGAAGQYAMVVHEDMEATHAPPTKAKFLEDPVVQGADGVADTIARKIREALAE